MSVLALGAQLCDGAEARSSRWERDRSNGTRTNCADWVRLDLSW